MPLLTSATSSCLMGQEITFLIINLRVIGFPQGIHHGSRLGTVFFLYICLLIYSLIEKKITSHPLSHNKARIICKSITPFGPLPNFSQNSSPGFLSNVNLTAAHMGQSIFFRQTHTSHGHAWPLLWFSLIC